MKIAIVGHGIAGAAASRLLHDSGHQVVCFESRSGNASSGAGLCLHPIGVDVLAQMGLASALRESSVPIAEIAAFDARGRPLSRVHAHELGSASISLGLQRETLHQLLTRDACAVQTCEVTQIDPARGALYSHGESLGTFDLVLIASGSRAARSIVQGHCDGERNEYATSALVCLVDSNEELPPASLLSFYDQVRHLSVWPVGAAPEARRKHALALSVLPGDEISTAPDVWMRACISQLAPNIAAAIGSSAALRPFHYRYADVVRTRYCDERVVVLGDAAHAMSPQFGLGASLALHDAWTLCTLLAQHHDARTAASMFDQTQRQFHAPIQARSRIATPIFQSNAWLAHRLRRLALVHMGRDAARWIHGLHAPHAPRAYHTR